MTFIKNNLEILAFYLISQMGVFTFVTILPILLKANQDFSSTIISYGTTIFVVVFTISNIYHTTFSDKKKDVLNRTITLLLLEIVSIFILVIIFTSDSTLDKDILIGLFFASRVLNGWTGGGVITLTWYILKLKLFKERKKELINSRIETALNSTKYVMPIIGSLSSEVLHPVAPVLIGLTAIVIGISIMFAKRKKLHFHYHLNIQRSKKNNNEKLINGIRRFIKKDYYRPVRIHFAITALLKNITRPFIDFYIPMLLISAYTYKVSEVAFVMSFVLLGTLTQAFLSGIIERLSTGVHQLITSSILLTCIVNLVFNLDIYSNLYALCSVMFIIGITGAMHQNWSYKILNRINKDGVKFNHSNLINNFLRGVGQNITFLVISVLIGQSIGAVYIGNFVVIVSILLLITSLSEIRMDRKYYIDKAIGNK